MSPLALLELAKVAGLWLFDIAKLLADPKVWLIALAAASFGFVRGCEDEKGRYDEHLALDKERAELAAAKAKARDEYNRKIKEGIDRESKSSLADLRIERDALEQRLRERPFRIRVVRPSSGAARTVQPGCSDGERAFLGELYAGTTLCYGRDYLVDGLQQIVGGALGRAFERAGKLAEPATTALDDSRWWGNWAIKVDACKPEAP